MTPEQWLERLNKRLDERQAALILREQYYLGEHRLAFASSKFRETFGKLFTALAVNYCLLVVDAERERLHVEGFRMGADDDTADKDAWRIWQRNKLDARSSVAHAEALAKGTAYVLVWANPRDPSTPLIRVQDARKVFVELDDGEEESRLAGIKRWLDVDGHEMCTIYLPEATYKYRSREKVQPGWAQTRTKDHWERRNVQGEEWPLTNPIGVVPIVPLLNNPLLSNDGRSELDAVIPIQDAINKLVADMIVASEFVAFPQRYATGIEVPVDAEGREVEPFKAGVSRLWMADMGVDSMGNPVKPEFGQFPQASLEPYVSAIELLVQAQASITKTPAHYLLGQSGNFPSGESLKATETGLVAKARGAMRYFGDSWEESMRLAYRWMGDMERAEAMDAETIWRDPESRVLSEVTDAMGKQVAQLQVPVEVAWERIGYSQTEIQRMQVLRQQSMLQGLATLPAAPPAINGEASPLVRLPQPPGGGVTAS
jgi:hypothetical protein